VPASASGNPAGYDQKISDTMNMVQAQSHSAQWLSDNPAAQAIDDVAQFLPNTTIGAAKGVGTSLLGLDNLIRHGLNKIGGRYADVDESDFGGTKGLLETKGVGQAVGNIGENVGEFFGGEELLGMLGKAGKGVEGMKGAAQLAQMLERYPRIAKLLHLGVSAAKQAAITGGQTYVKTGGDEDAAAEAAKIAGVTGFSIEGAAALAKAGLRYVTPAIEKIGGVEVPVPRGATDIKPTPEQAAGQKVYRETAQETARPALDDINTAREPQTVGSQAATDADNKFFQQAKASLPEGSVSDWAKEAQRLKTGASEEIQTAPKINVGEQLDRVHDFTGAADLVEEQAQGIYQRADKVTGGFKDANNKLKQAQKSYWQATGADRTAAAQRVTDARDAIEKMIDDSHGKLSAPEIQAARMAFRRSYALREVGNTLDASWSGLPGSSNRANAYRGFDGNRLMSGLQRLQRQMGRKGLDTLLGPGRLDNLERIAELNRTNANRAKFGAAVEPVVRYLVPHMSTAALGGYVAHQAGLPWEVGAAGGFAAGQAWQKVMRAVAANPKIGNYLTYAIDSGARPERYGPMLGTMIQRMESGKKEEGEQ
jgi:hypothetical protein